MWKLLRTTYVQKKRPEKSALGCQFRFAFPLLLKKSCLSRGPSCLPFKKVFNVQRNGQPTNFSFTKSLKDTKTGLWKGGRAKTLMAFLFLWEICETRTFSVPSCPHRTVDIHLFLMSTLPPSHSHFVLWRSRYNFFFQRPTLFCFSLSPLFPLKKFSSSWLIDCETAVSQAGRRPSLPPPPPLLPQNQHNFLFLLLTTYCALRRKKRKGEIVQLPNFCGKFKNAGFRYKTTFKYFGKSQWAQLDTEFSF